MDFRLPRQSTVRRTHLLRTVLEGVSGPKKRVGRRCAAPSMPGKEYDAAPAVPGATQGTAGKSITDSLRGCAAPVTVIDDAAQAARSPAEAFRGRLQHTLDFPGGV